MSHQTSIDKVHPELLQQDVAGQIESAAMEIEAKGITVEAVPVTYTLACDPISILDWLQGCEIIPQVYWRSRDGELELGGIGTSILISTADEGTSADAFAKIRNVLRTQSQNPYLRFVGGTRFDPESRRDALWQGFPDVWFALPQIIVSKHKGRHFVTVAATWGGQGRLSSVREELLEAYDLFLRSLSVKHLRPSVRILARSDVPDERQWVRNVESALEMFGSDALSKVVLARRADQKTDGAASAHAVIRTLVRTNPSCYAFLLSPRRHSTFFGISPERLFRLEGVNLQTEAVAGTFFDGVTEEASDRAKNHLEQEHVIEGIRARLSQLCSVYTENEPGSQVRFANIRHLRTTFSGQLKPAVYFGDVYGSFHPTPAVGGTPTTEAMRFIRDHEGFDRGWYASGFGMISEKLTEMAVAIRSGLVTGGQVSLFSGAGIVEGSQPKLEWQELEQKIAPILTALHGEEK